MASGQDARTPYLSNIQSDRRRIEATAMPLGWSEDIMEKPSSLELSLLIMATAVFLLVWAIGKIVNQGHAQNVFKTFYFSTPSPEILTALGVVQTLIVVAFAAGFARFWTYGAVLLMHLASTASTYARLINPWGPELSCYFGRPFPCLPLCFRCSCCGSRIDYCRSMPREKGYKIAIAHTADRTQEPHQICEATNESPS
jgi:hypothetical protein